MAEIKLNEQLALLRKQKGVTQEELAKVLGVTNQAVSKWEGGACCPDISLLPDIADFFGVSIDTLFGKNPSMENKHISVQNVPWEDDDTVRVAVFRGKKIINDMDSLSEFTYELEGVVENIECGCNLKCGDIAGDASAGGGIECADIAGNASAGNTIKCENIDGEASAGYSIICKYIGGDLSAGFNITCENIDGELCEDGD